MVVRAAFDVSKDCPHGVTTVAGYIANMDTWQSVEAHWKKQLILAGLEVFRLSEIRHRFPHGEWIEVVTPFARITMEAGLRSVTSSLRDTDWRRLDHDSEYRKICPHREHACLDLLFGVLADDLRLQFGNEPAFVVFDKDYGNTKSLFKVYEAWPKRTGQGGFHIALKGDLPWDSVPLQCADMVAGLLRINPLSLGMLDHRFDGPHDHDPISEIAGMALSYARDTMWSSALAAEVEKLSQKVGALRFSF